jgi:hypothetical protein
MLGGIEIMRRWLLARARDMLQHWLVFPRHQPLSRDVSPVAEDDAFGVYGTGWLTYYRIVLLVQ